MSQTNLGTSCPNTWCPGCGNFAILNGMKAVLNELKDQIPLENFVFVSGIGCHAKIVDYVNVNSFYAIHGRTVPVAEGIKIAKPGLKVICFAGDGDAYGEGLEHLIFAAKRNVDITVVIHNNRSYSLTAFQSSPTSPAGFKGRSTPQGSIEAPLNPLELLLAAKATFLARAASQGLPLLMHVLREAILHKGFALIDVLQVCATYHNLYEYYARKIYELQNHDPKDSTAAWSKVREWDYNSDAGIALGIFHQRQEATFEEKFGLKPITPQERSDRIKQLLQKTI